MNLTKGQKTEFVEVDYIFVVSSVNLVKYFYSVHVIDAIPVFKERLRKQQK